MNIAIVGLGYVGCVSAACLADLGHRVTGVDVNAEKVATVTRGESPIHEPGLAELIAAGRASGRLDAVTSLDDLEQDPDVVFVAVGTPSSPSGDADLTALERVVGDLAGRLTTASTVAIVSTVPPGTVRSRLLPLLEAAGENRPKLVFVPEFLREASAIADHMSPERTVYGVLEEGDEVQVRELLSPLGGAQFVVPVETAELVKLTDNAWHATKVTFANEIGRLARANGADSSLLHEIFISDHRLNISPAYLRPGFAFGGSCLPKDLRTIVYRSRVDGVDIPMLSAVAASNRAHIERALELILEQPGNRVLLMGLAFKKGTDDLRESPYVELAERLLGKGFELFIHDPAVRPDELIGSNKSAAVNALPHLQALMVDDPSTVMDRVDTVVVAHRSDVLIDLTDDHGGPVIDLTSPSELGVV